MQDDHGKNKHASPNRMKVEHLIDNDTRGEITLMRFRFKLIHSEKITMGTEIIQEYDGLYFIFMEEKC